MEEEEDFQDQNKFVRKIKTVFRNKSKAVNTK